MSGLRPASAASIRDPGLEARSARYVGRFAPSPTGPLHAGSVLTAVASYLHARQSHGEWLVRIEDIDPPREVAGAADDILRTLEALELHWDRSVLFQRERFAVYEHVAACLLERGLAFRCDCSRSALRAFVGSGGPSRRYPGTCRDRGLHGADTAVRVRVEGPGEPIEDGLQGLVTADALTALGDFVIRRRDALPAYHLAVVVDDAHQGVTTVVRGSDLLDSTAPQRYLQRVLGLPVPAYFHLPIVTTASGEKLSKQTGARPVDASDASGVAAAALTRLRRPPPPELRGARPSALWEWAAATWRIESLQGVRSVALD